MPHTVIYWVLLLNMALSDSMIDVFCEYIWGETCYRHLVGHHYWWNRYWFVISRHTRNNVATFPDDNLADASNYCRNPDNEPNGPWCYTTDADTRWEYCSLALCLGKKLYSFILSPKITESSVVVGSLIHVILSIAHLLQTIAHHTTVPPLLHDVFHYLV